MGRQDRDDESVVTVNFDEDVPRTKTGKPLSEKKLRQLADAREKALLTRRKKLKDKLEAKLGELRQILGPDNRPDIERVAHLLLKQEETLRSKQNALTLETKDVIKEFKADLDVIKQRLSKPSLQSHSLSSLAQHSKPKHIQKPRTVSEVSSTGSGRTLTLAM